MGITKSFETIDRITVCPTRDDAARGRAPGICIDFSSLNQRDLDEAIITYDQAKALSDALMLLAGDKVAFPDRTLPDERNKAVTSAGYCRRCKVQVIYVSRELNPRIYFCTKCGVQDVVADCRGMK